MKEVKLITDLHPNEKVAAYAAPLIAEKLEEEGIKVEVVNFETWRRTQPGKKLAWNQEMDENSTGRLDKLIRLVEEHRGKLVVTVEDCDVTKLEDPRGRFNFPKTPVLLDTGEPYRVLEIPAVYVPQTDAEIANLGKRHSLHFSGYFTQQSDIERTTSKGLIGADVITKISELIKTMC